MLRNEAEEAGAIVNRMLGALLTTCARSTGTTGSDLRRVVGDLRADATSLLMDGGAGISERLFECFNAAREAGATYPKMGHVRELLLLEEPVSLPATIVRQYGVLNCLMQEARIIASMKFVSRTDVEAIQATVLTSFDDAENMAADDMDSAVYRALVGLHAAVSFHLIATARPLPQIITFEFATTFPTLVMAQRLYADASRADELRAENKVVHPLFPPRIGRALSR